MIPTAIQRTVEQQTVIVPPEKRPSRTYCIDFSSGRISGFVDQNEAMKQAIYKILQTRRFDHVIYSWNYGIELDKAMGRNYQVFCSEVKRVIREALMADSRVKEVVDFDIVRVDQRTAAVSFTAKTVFGDIPAQRSVKMSV